MSTALIQTVQVSIGESRSTVEVVATLVEGEVKANSSLNIKLNRSLSVQFPIAQIIDLVNGQITLILECEDEAEALFLKALNFENEMLLTESSRSGKQL